MPPDFDSRLRSLAEVVVRVGLNLQPGQPLLITDPYELLGVHPEAVPLANAIKAAAGTETTILTADPAGLRALAEADHQKGYVTRVAVHTAWLRRHLRRNGAFLFLTGSAPGLFAGLPADRLARFDAVKWRLLGPVIQKLVRGASQWTLAPAPSLAWANLAFSDLPAAARLDALWEVVFDALRVGTAPNPEAVSAWPAHLAALSRRRDELNAARYRNIHYRGPGTELTLALPASHVWCTAQLVSRHGVPFVVNLPTEEVFTAPHKNSALGKVQISRPIVHGGAVIEDITLDFRLGKVVSGGARIGNDALQHLLGTDSGAGRIGEVAIVGPVAENPPGGGQPERESVPAWRVSGRLFHHTLLDENSAPHIALGDAYRFCNRSLLPLALNSSQVHVDLPLEATVSLE